MPDRSLIDEPDERWPKPPAGYLDAVAGQPLLPVARRAWLAAEDLAWSDPARLHHLGRRSGLTLDAARASVATALGVRPEEVYFTSSGPAALSAAITGVAHGRASVAHRVIVSAVESMAVMSPADRLELTGGRVDVVPVDADGRVDLGALAAALDEPAALVCLQAANAEVGTRQPFAAAAALAHDRGVPVLMDATQVVGRDPLPQAWDLMTAVARDWGGPAGVGVLVVRSSVRWIPDEAPDRGWVEGFPDIAGAAAAATALEYVQQIAPSEAARLRSLVDRVRSEVARSVDGVVVAGDPVDRLPHIVTLSFTGLPGEALVAELERRGISVASGSACTADTRMPSHVLAAMGLPAEASIRVSLPLGCTEQTVDDFLSALPDAVTAARATFDV